jgi:hypothetical protein
MKYTLLELTQRILSAIDGDEVSSIAETTDSQTVANILKECYFDIISNLHPAESEGLFKLDASTDNTKPVLMTLPSSVSKVHWLKYDTGADIQNFQPLRYVDPEEFIFYQSGVNLTDPETGVMTVTIDGKHYDFRYRTDEYPTCYTILRDKYVIFDQFSSSDESTLTEARSLGFGELVPYWDHSDTFIPDLDPRHFQLLLKEAKATAFSELKQIENQRAERTARRNWVLTQKTRDDNAPEKSVQSKWGYGRKGARYYPDMKRAMRYGK